MLEWALWKEGIPEVLVISVMSLYEGVIMRVRVDCWLSEEFEVKVWMHQGSVLSPFHFLVMVDVVTEFARGCAKDGMSKYKVDPCGVCSLRVNSV